MICFAFKKQNVIHAYLSVEIIQYADDTLIITEAHPVTLKIITCILRTYTEVSRLKLNPRKSSLVLIAVPLRYSEVIHRILQATPTQLPLTYLGLPLMMRKPTHTDFQPMLTVIQKKLEGRQTSFLSYGGRITLVKAVLSSMSLHFMQATKIPVGVMKLIDKMRRFFLWKDKNSYKRINCLVN